MYLYSVCNEPQPLLPVFFFLFAAPFFVALLVAGGVATLGVLSFPMAAKPPPIPEGVASAPVGVDCCPLENSYSLRLLRLSEGLSAFLLLAPVVLTAPVVRDELPVAVCAEAKEASPKHTTAVKITRFIFICLSKQVANRGPKSHWPQRDYRGWNVALLKYIPTWAMISVLPAAERLLGFRCDAPFRVLFAVKR